MLSTKLLTKWDVKTINGIHNFGKTCEFLKLKNNVQ
jgi:hypothetical protein